MDNGSFNPFFRDILNSSSASSSAPERRPNAGRPLPVTTDEDGEEWFSVNPVVPPTEDSRPLDHFQITGFEDFAIYLLGDPELHGRYGNPGNSQTPNAPSTSFQSPRTDPTSNRTNFKRFTNQVNTPKHRRLSHDVRRQSILDTQLKPLEPASPTPSEEATPPRTPNHTPTPPRTPPPPTEDVLLIAPPSSPASGVDLKRQELLMNNIDIGLSWAHSWIDHVKPSRNDEEGRISLPRICQVASRNRSVMFVAHKNVDETIFHKFEFRFRTEKKMRQAFSRRFNVPMPSRRIRLSLNDEIEVPLFHAAVERFESVEYVRLDTSRRNYWILYHIVNSAPVSYGT